MSEVTFMSTAEVAQLRRLRKLWVLGWVIAAVSAGFGCWEAALVKAMRVQQVQVSVLAQEQRRVAEEQRLVVDNLTTIGNRQSRLASSVLEMGEYFKERQEVVDRNRALAPLTRKNR
jgi:hypothetical protein